MRLRWRRRRDLAERLRPYLPDQFHPEPMVDVDPIRMFLYRWMIETGDPIEVVAKGFDLEVGLIRGLLGRSPRAFTRREASAIARKLRLVPEDSQNSWDCAEASAEIGEVAERRIVESTY